jgi:hypothetical protein
MPVGSHWCLRGLGVLHPKPLEKILCILRLGDEVAVLELLYLEPKEVGQLAHHQHLELLCHHPAKLLTRLLISSTVIEPLKLLGPPTVVLVQRTSDNPAGAPDHLTSSVSVFLTFPKSVSPITQTLQYIGGTKMRKQLQ